MRSIERITRAANNAHTHRYLHVWCRRVLSVYKVPKYYTYILLYFILLERMHTTHNNNNNDMMSTILQCMRCLPSSLPRDSSVRSRSVSRDRPYNIIIIYMTRNIAGQCPWRLVGPSPDNANRFVSVTSQGMKRKRNKRNEKKWRDFCCSVVLRG